MNHLTPTPRDIARPFTDTFPVPAHEGSCPAPEVTRRWWRHLSRRAWTSGFATNRYVIGDRSQADEIQSLREASPLRLLLIHAVITVLLAVTAVEIGLLR